MVSKSSCGSISPECGENSATLLNRQKKAVLLVQTPVPEDEHHRIPVMPLPDCFQGNVCSGGEGNWKLPKQINNHKYIPILCRAIGLIPVSLRSSSWKEETLSCFNFNRKDMIIKGTTITQFPLLPPLDTLAIRCPLCLKVVRHFNLGLHIKSIRCTEDRAKGDMSEKIEKAVRSIQERFLLYGVCDDEGIDTVLKLPVDKQTTALDLVNTLAINGTIIPSSPSSLTNIRTSSLMYLRSNSILCIPPEIILKLLKEKQWYQQLDDQEMEGGCAIMPPPPSQPSTIIKERVIENQNTASTCLTIPPNSKFPPVVTEAAVYFGVMEASVISGESLDPCALPAAPTIRLEASGKEDRYRFYGWPLLIKGSTIPVSDLSFLYPVLPIGESYQDGVFVAPPWQSSNEPANKRPKLFFHKNNFGVVSPQDINGAPPSSSSIASIAFDCYHNFTRPKKGVDERLLHYFTSDDDKQDTQLHPTSCYSLRAARTSIVRCGDCIGHDANSDSTVTGLFYVHMAVCRRKYGEKVASSSQNHKPPQLNANFRQLSGVDYAIVASDLRFILCGAILGGVLLGDHEETENEVQRMVEIRREYINGAMRPYAIGPLKKSSVVFETIFNIKLHSPTFITPVDAQLYMLHAINAGWYLPRHPVVMDVLNGLLGTNIDPQPIPPIISTNHTNQLSQLIASIEVKHSSDESEKSSVLLNNDETVTTAESISSLISARKRQREEESLVHDKEANDLLSCGNAPRTVPTQRAEEIRSRNADKCERTTEEKHECELKTPISTARSLLPIFSSLDVSPPIDTCSSISSLTDESRNSVTFGNHPITASKHEIHSNAANNTSPFNSIKGQCAVRGTSSHCQGAHSLPPPPFVIAYSLQFITSVGIPFQLSSKQIGIYFSFDKSCIILDTTTNMFTYVNRHRHRFSICPAAVKGPQIGSKKDISPPVVIVPVPLERKFLALLWVRDVLNHPEKSTMFGFVRIDTHPCELGSKKTTFGHLTADNTTLSNPVKMFPFEPLPIGSISSVQKLMSEIDDRGTNDATRSRFIIVSSFEEASALFISSVNHQRSQDETEGDQTGVNCIVQGQTYPLSLGVASSALDPLSVPIHTQTVLSRDTVDLSSFMSYCSRRENCDGKAPLPIEVLRQLSDPRYGLITDTSHPETSSGSSDGGAAEATVMTFPPLPLFIARTDISYTVHYNGTDTPKSVEHHVQFVLSNKSELYPGGLYYASDDEHDENIVDNDCRSANANPISPIALGPRLGHK